MGYIKEPKGIDFIIQSDPLDDKARKEISDFIRAYKAKQDTQKKATARKGTVKSMGKNKVKSK